MKTALKRTKSQISEKIKEIGEKTIVNNAILSKLFIPEIDIKETDGTLNNNLNELEWTSLAIHCQYCDYAGVVWVGPNKTVSNEMWHMDDRNNRMCAQCFSNSQMDKTMKIKWKVDGEKVPFATD